MNGGLVYILEDPHGATMETTDPLEAWDFYERGAAMVSVYRAGGTA